MKAAEKFLVSNKHPTVPVVATVGYAFRGYEHLTVMTLREKPDYDVVSTKRALEVSMSADEAEDLAARLIEWAARTRAYGVHK